LLWECPVFAVFPGDEVFLRMRLRWFDVACDQNGTALVEFTFVLPVVLFLLLGMLQFGIIFYNYVLVTRAAVIGARTLSISRLDLHAYTDVESTITQATSNIPSSSLTITMSVNGTACSSNSGCQAALQNAHNAFAVPPQPVSVTVSYSCSSTSIVPAYLINLTGICPLRTTMQAAVE
jgi:Flp pilus assembly protein TadG